MKAKTKTVKPAVTQSEVQILNIPLSLIAVSPYNPRKYFDEQKMQELTDSIRVQGVLQPILVRLLKSGKYEIIYGERRYRASAQCGLKTIPATLRNIQDDDAKELALTENLQRQDITDLEEANAFNGLIETGRYDVKRLVDKFGKSETYIRNRLSLLNLCEEFILMLNKKEIIFSIALELSHYEIEQQKEIYRDHFTNEVSYYQDWRDLKFTDFVNRLQMAYSCRLNDYFFDKLTCQSCAFNSACQNLFVTEETNPVCKNRKCLNQKNTEYLINTVMEYLHHDNLLKLTTYIRDTNHEAIKQLQEYGLEISEVAVTAYPDVPVMPRREDYSNEGNYLEAVEDYNADQAYYMGTMEELTERYHNGEISRYIVLSEKSVTLGYMEVEKEKKIAEIKENRPSETETVVARLKQQDARNLELKNENTILEVKTFIRSNDAEIPRKKSFSEQEEKIFYFLLLPFITDKTLKSLGFNDAKYYLTYDDKLQIVNRLTLADKNRIKRDFIIKQLETAYGNNTEAKLLTEFLQLHFPDNYASISKKYEQIYEKRHAKIVEKLSYLEIQDTVCEATEEGKENRYLPAVVTPVDNFAAFDTAINDNSEEENIPVEEMPELEPVEIEPAEEDPLYFIENVA